MQLRISGVFLPKSINNDIKSEIREITINDRLILGLVTMDVNNNNANTGDNLDPPK